MFETICVDDNFELSRTLNCRHQQNKAVTNIIIVPFDTPPSAIVCRKKELLTLAQSHFLNFFSGGHFNSKNVIFLKICTFFTYLKTYKRVRYGKLPTKFDFSDFIDKRRLLFSKSDHTSRINFLAIRKPQ